MQHDESAVRLEPSRDGPFDIAVVEHVDVFVHDHDTLHRRVGPEGGHDRILPVALMLLADRDDPVEPGASSLRPTDVPPARRFHGSRPTQIATFSSSPAAIASLYMCRRWRGTIRQAPRFRSRTWIRWKERFRTPPRSATQTPAVT